MIDDAPVLRLAGAQPPRRIHQIEGPAQTGDSRQALAAAPAGHQPESCMLVAQARAFAGKDDVTSEHKLYPACQCEAMHCGHDGEGRGFKMAQHGMARADECGHLSTIGAGRQDFIQIRPRAELFAVGAHEHGPDRWVRLEMDEGRVDTGDQVR